MFVCLCVSASLHLVRFGLSCADKHYNESIHRKEQLVQVCIINTSRVPVEGKSSVCLICMKYRIFLIIIIINLGQILLSYIANTSRTDARTRVKARSAGDNSWSLAIEINTGTGGPVSPRF